MSEADLLLLLAVARRDAQDARAAARLRSRASRRAVRLESHLARLDLRDCFGPWGAA